MGDRRARLRRTGAVVAAVLALAGCAGIPDSGAIRVGREISAEGGLDDIDVRVLPPAPLPGMSAADIVHGFLRAMVNGDGDYEIARAYLTDHAALTWDAGVAVTMYDDGGVTLTATETSEVRQSIRVQAPRVGSDRRPRRLHPEVGHDRRHAGAGPAERTVADRQARPTASSCRSPTPRAPTAWPTSTTSTAPAARWCPSRCCSGPTRAA